MDLLLRLESMEDFSNVLRDVCGNIEDPKFTPKSVFKLHVIKAIKEDLVKLISDSNFILDNVKVNLQSKGLDQQKIYCLMSILEENKTELLYSSLLIQYSNFSETVTDFNWVLKLVMGSNDLKSLRYPIFQLVLSTYLHGESKKSVYDVNKDMLAKIIKSLETIVNE